MKRMILLLTVLIITTYTFAQTHEWLWAENAGGIYDDEGRAIDIDAEGNSYVTGYFNETASFGSFNLTSSGGRDIFVAKIDANGNWLWAESAGGSYSEEGRAISIDTNGNLYVTGRFSGTASFGSFNLTSNGDFDIFIAKMDPNGNWLWAESIGGIDDDEGSAISIDADGNLYVTGHFEETASFGSFNLTSSGWQDIFVAKLDSNGNWLWAISTGGSYCDEGHAINTDADGNVYVTGRFTLSSSSDIFVAKINSIGNWQWAISAGGNNYDFGNAISIDDDGNIYVTGMFRFSASFGSFEKTSNGFRDVFVAKIDNITSVENEIIPTIKALSNYPNPFNPLTNIQFNIKENEKCVLSIYNIKGQLIESQQFESGQQNYIWDASNQNSGIYLYKLETENVTQTRKMLLLK